MLTLAHTRYNTYGAHASVQLIRACNRVPLLRKVPEIGTRTWPFGEMLVKLRGTKVMVMVASLLR